MNRDRFPPPGACGTIDALNYCSSARSQPPSPRTCAIATMKVLASLRSILPIARLASSAHLRGPVPRTWPAVRQRLGRLDLRARAIASSLPYAESVPSKINIYTDFCVYKTKGAVALKVIKPTWSRVSTGSGLTVAREGTLLLEFAASIGDKQYDWERKGTFALSALECADVLEALESGREKNFFHDPSKGSSGEGQVSKSLKIIPAPQPGTFYMNLAVRDKASQDSLYSTGLSSAEARVMRTILNFAIPRLLGFDEVFTSPIVIREDSAEGGSPPPF